MAKAAEVKVALTPEAAAIVKSLAERMDKVQEAIEGLTIEFQKIVEGNMQIFNQLRVIRMQEEQRLGESVGIVTPVPIEDCQAVCESANQTSCQTVSEEFGPVYTAFCHVCRKIHSGEC